MPSSRLRSRQPGAFTVEDSDSVEEFKYPFADNSIQGSGWFSLESSLSYKSNPQ